MADVLVRDGFAAYEDNPVHRRAVRTLPGRRRPEGQEGEVLA
jgi:hypothetical protein